MNHPGNISISDYTYDLTEDRIALSPLPERDKSKLLIYKNGNLREDIYRNIDQYLPENTLLVFNDTKVINARLNFNKSTGASIEIFCLEPSDDINEYASIMAKKGKVKWKCFVGGAAKWKDEPLEKRIEKNGKSFTLKAAFVERLSDAYIIDFSWLPSDLSFAEVLEGAGNIPLPPYIKRKTVSEDTERYQTIYAEHEGSVAAPTAGLHFTKEIFEKLAEKKIGKAYVTLHVGAGTFKPVKAANMFQHEMHAEWIDVNIETIKTLIKQKGDIIAIGTTSLRTIETLYWLGVKIFLNPSTKDPELNQWDPYQKELREAGIFPDDALKALATWMEKNKLENIFTRTRLLIAPGYKFKIVKGLVTNFHQPGSTLLLLVAAAVGENWKKIYSHALQHGYRFLSYGDGNLIFIDQG